MLSALDLPNVMTEVETINHAWHKRVSLSRYGDGELRLATGGTAVTQRRRSRDLFEELRYGLEYGVKGCLTCIPRLTRVSPNYQNWTRYYEPKYAALYTQGCYGSSLITRPDSAPWIDDFMYWESIQRFWTNRHIILVRGDGPQAQHGMQPSMFLKPASANKKRAEKVHEVLAPEVEAYSEIDAIEHHVMQIWKTHINGLDASKQGPVIMCLGATATCLAMRLTSKGIWALDFGHMGKYISRSFIGVES